MSELTYSIFDKKEIFNKPQPLLNVLNLEKHNFACLFTAECTKSTWWLICKAEH